MPSTALAVELGTCDPNEDPYGCECDPDLSQYGACYESSSDNWVSPDDPAALNNAANISSWYDETDEIWVVEADVSQLNGGGILPVPSNHGEWQSMDELQEYLSTLLDLPRDQENGTLPEFRYIQNGTVARWDLDQSAWATHPVDNLVDASISGPDGEVYMSSVSIYQWYSAAAPGGRSSYGDLSFVFDTLIDLNQVFWTQPDGTELIVMRGEAISKVHSLKWKGFSTKVVCNTVYGIDHCRTQQIHADEIFLRNKYFHDGNKIAYPGGQTETNTPSSWFGRKYPDSEYTGELTPNGMCGYTDVIKSGEGVQGLFNRIGKYGDC